MHVYRKLGAGRVPAAVLLTTVQCAPWGRLRVFKQVPQHTFAMQIHYRGKGNCPQLTEIEAELAKLVLYSNRWASWSSFSFPVFKMLSSAMQSSTFPPLWPEMQTIELTQVFRRSVITMLSRYLILFITISVIYHHLHVLSVIFILI